MINDEREIMTRTENIAHAQTIELLENLRDAHIIGAYEIVGGTLFVRGYVSEDDERDGVTETSSIEYVIGDMS
jgi:hypothetical protein